MGSHLTHLPADHNRNTLFKGLEMQSPTQQSFMALWDYREEVKSGSMSVKTASKLCLQARNARAKQLRANGVRVHCFTLAGQIRQYWGLGDPCGLSCPAYYIQTH